jgi:hypothetical protein
MTQPSVSFAEQLPDKLAEPDWDIDGVVRALEPFGLPSHEVALLCSVCVPQHTARGLYPALQGLESLWSDDPAVQAWGHAVDRWTSQASRKHRAGLTNLPGKRLAPITRFLADVAPSLPISLGQAVLVRLLTLLAAGQAAEAPCYRLYLAARHLQEENQRSPSVRDALRVGSYLAAIAVMEPPTVREPQVLEAYRTALRNALGQRKSSIRIRHIDRASSAHDGAPERRPPNVPKRDAASLRFALAAVIERVSTTPSAAEEEPNSESSPARSFRRSGALATNRARGIPLGLRDLDALRMAILLRRLQRSDLDERTMWALGVVLKVQYITGWSTQLLAQLGRSGGIQLDVGSSTLTIAGELYPAAAKVASDGVRLWVADEVIRLLRSVLDSAGRLTLAVGDAHQPISSRMVGAVLRYLSTGDACPTTTSMLRGAVWHTGRAAGWTPERLVLATCTWDPAFTRAFHYWHGSPEQDIRDLHELMLQRLRRGEQRIAAIEAGHGFAVV